jgi:hypothetical protein
VSFLILATYWAHKSLCADNCCVGSMPLHSTSTLPTCSPRRACDRHSSIRFASFLV